MLNRSLVILHTESHRAWGGQEMRVLSECLWMKKKGHRPILVASQKSQIISKAKAAGLEVRPMTFSILTALGDLIRLRAWLKKSRPDVLNTHGNMDAKVGLVAALGLGIPCVVRSRHHSHPVSPTWYNKLMYRHLSHYVFTTADSTSRQIIRDLSVAPAKVVTLASGITPPATLMDREAARHRLQRELHLPTNARFLGSVARLGDWKGHRLIIDGFADICQAFPNHHLVFVGDGSEMASLRQQCERMGLSDKVHLIGFRKDPWPYFRAFDLNVLASTKNEGIPQVLLQAMYARCPVIGTRTGGIPDIVEDGVSGLLVASGSSTALAQAMQTLLIKPEEAARFSEKAFSFVSQHHTIDRMGHKILSLYQQVLCAQRQDAAAAGVFNHRQQR
jgi:glycosyltransferase involved in cell wall biosynthesis